MLPALCYFFTDNGSRTKTETRKQIELKEKVVQLMSETVEDAALIKLAENRILVAGIALLSGNWSKKGAPAYPHCGLHGKALKIFERDHYKPFWKAFCKLTKDFDDKTTLT